MLMRRAPILLALSPLATQGVIEQPPTERPAGSGGAVTPRTFADKPFLTDGEAAAWVAKLLESRSRDNVVSDRD